MDDIPLSVMFGTLAFLLVLSAFFSGSETGLMTLNRYRLRHLVRAKHPGAIRAQRLLEHPDRLIGLILLGNNFVNILASSVATLIGLRLYGETGLAIATGLLTMFMLIFSEVAPKTFGALHPERVAFPAAFIYTPLSKLLYPLVWAINKVANALLRALGLPPAQGGEHALSREELRTVVLEAGALIPKRHQKMLLNLMDLEKVVVEDIMIPRNEVVGIDIHDDIDQIIDIIVHTQYTRLPVYEDSIDNVIGLLHLRNVIPLLKRGEITQEELREATRPPYFIPEGTTLNRQLLNFQREAQRTGLVVDEYGDIQGLVALEDILEEIVGEFTTDPGAVSKDITPQEDGSFLIDCAAYIRDLNRALHTELPTDGPKTLNGLILEHMQNIPEAGTSLLLAGYPIEIVQTKDNAVKIARITPQKRRPQAGA